MTTTIEALKNLYVALGGTASDVEDINIIPDMINALVPLATALTANQLPEVSATNNGSVLKVADGKWGIGTDAT